MINIYTDGGFRPKYKIGAYAYIILSGGQIVNSECEAVILQPEMKVTNITMEMTAAIKGLETLLAKQEDGKGKHVYLITDSQYVQLGLTEWYTRWRTNGWRGANGKRVQNLEKWKKLYKLYMKVKKQYSSMTVQWTRGHSNDEFNNQVDRMCNVAMDEYVINMKK